jgi:hypothetical protein
LSEFLGLGASSGDDNGGGLSAGAFIIWYQPSGLRRKRKASVESGEFFANVW